MGKHLYGYNVADLDKTFQEWRDVVVALHYPKLGHLTGSFYACFLASATEVPVPALIKNKRGLIHFA